LGCDGGIIEACYDYIKTAGGINTEKDYPYEAKTDTCRFNRTTVAANCTVNDRFEFKSSFD